MNQRFSTNTLNPRDTWDASETHPLKTGLEYRFLVLNLWSVHCYGLILHFFIASVASSLSSLSCHNQWVRHLGINDWLKALIRGMLPSRRTRHGLEPMMDKAFLSLIRPRPNYRSPDWRKKPASAHQKFQHLWSLQTPWCWCANLLRSNQTSGWQWEVGGCGQS